MSTACRPCTAGPGVQIHGLLLYSQHAHHTLLTCCLTCTCFCGHSSLDGGMQQQALSALTLNPKTLYAARTSVLPLQSRARRAEASRISTPLSLEPNSAALRMMARQAALCWPASSLAAIHLHAPVSAPHVLAMLLGHCQADCQSANLQNICSVARSCRMSGFCLKEAEKQSQHLLQLLGRLTDINQYILSLLQLRLWTRSCSYAQCQPFMLPS